MKTLLINPPWFCFQNRKDKHVPIGLAYIAGTLTAAGHEVRILNGEKVLAPYTIDETTESEAAFFHATEKYVKFHDLALPGWERFKDAIAAEKPDIVGVTMWSGAYQSAVNTCKLVKSLDPGIVTIVGGIHPTIDPISVVKRQEVDFVVCGEGERAAEELWAVLAGGGDSLEKSRHIRGLWTKTNGGIHNGGKAEMIESLDELPLPDYEAVIGDPAESIVGIMTARGCPFDCTFCASKTIWGREVRFRSVESCIDELAHYREKFGLTWFRVNDDSFCIRRSRVLDFCSKLIRRFGYDSWTFHIDANVATLDEQVIDKLEWAGCTQISMGLESVVPRIQRLCHKRIDLNRARRIISYINQSKITSGVYFMTGFPHETEDELEQNIEFMKDTRPGNSMWSIVTPYPGTELHRYAREKNLIPDVDPIHLMHHSSKTSMADIPLERHEAILRRILRIRDDIAQQRKREKTWYGLRPVISAISRPLRSCKMFTERFHHSPHLSKP